MADSAPHTGYEPKIANFFSYMDPEHTLINIPGSHHDFMCPDDATMIPTSPEGLPYSEAFSGSQKAAACRVSSRFGHFGSSWLQETGTTTKLQKILERKVDSAVRGEREAQQKMYQAEAQVKARKWEIMKSIRSSSPNDYSYTKRINVLIRLKETK